MSLKPSFKSEVCCDSPMPFHDACVWQYRSFAKKWRAIHDLILVLLNEIS